MQQANAAAEVGCIIPDQTAPAHRTARNTRSSRRSGISTSTLLLPRLRDLQLLGCSIPLQHLKQLSKLTALTSLYLGTAEVLQTPYSQRLASEDAVQSALSVVLSQTRAFASSRMA